MAASKDKAGAAPVVARNHQGTDTTGPLSASLPLTEESVREFLKDNGDFLQRNPDLLDHLHVSHASGSAVSLVEKQVSVLRERNVELRHRLKGLTANARENDKLFDHTRALVVKLLEADSVAELYRSFLESMQKDFQVEFAGMILFGDEPGTEGFRVDTADNARTHVGALIGANKPFCGTLRREEFSYLFAGGAATHPFQQGGSAAIMPLSDGAQLGLLAVGSADPNRFTRDMGVLFLSHIGEVILRLLPRFNRQDA